MKKRKEKIILISFSILICFILYWVLFSPPHMGAANNGDFFRFAERCTLNGKNLFTEDTSPFFSKVYEKWKWKEMDWLLLTPIKQSFGNIWPIMLVRLITSIISDTTVTSFSTYYLALIYAGMFVIAAILLIKFAIKIMPRASSILIFTAIIILMGSMHLAWFNSFYGEATLFVGLLLSIAFLCQLIFFCHKPLETVFLLVFTCFFNYLFLTGKPQNVLAWPFWMIMLVITTVYVCRQTNKNYMRRGKRFFNVICIVIIGVYIVYSGISSYRLYQWNSEYNEKDTLYNAIMFGALELTQSDEEAKTMLTEMGLSSELILDKGKHAYRPANELNIVPRTEKAQKLIYDKINTFGILKFYITHPKYLYQVLEITASNAVYPATSLLMFVQDEPKDKNEIQERFAIWKKLRPLLVPHHFWQYFIIYLILFIVCIRSLLHYRTTPKYRLLIYLYMFIMITGIIQFPLPFIGNGYADTNKQLYLFMLCWDITMFIAVAWGLASLYKNFKRERK